MFGIFQDRISPEKYEKIMSVIEKADAIVIGAGAGLSTSAGFTYSGERFLKWFADFEDKYDFHDMYSGGFYPFKTMEEHWAYWSRYIYVNRYLDAPRPVYEQILDLVKEKDYFVLTTNVDHCFQKAGFDKKRLFYTQGDYGLFQCQAPCCQNTFDNQKLIYEMMDAQGYTLNNKKEYELKKGTISKMVIPTELIPKCKQCGKQMTMNLRSDDRFVQDEGWYQAAERYDLFIRRHEKMRIVYLELGVGYNTPSIIKYPFWRMTYKNENAIYICMNKEEAYCPKEIERRSICVDGDIRETLQRIMKEKSIA